jgi:hypothetical protein
LATRGSDSAYIARQLSDLGFNSNTATGKERRSSVFDLIDREISVAREANDGRLSEADRERVVKQAVGVYLRDASLFGGLLGRSLRENETEATRAQNMSREQLRARQNTPVVNDILARVFPADRPAPGAAAAVAMLVEDPSARAFTQKQRQDMRVVLQRQGIASPTPYQITAALVYDRDRADFQRGQ